MSGQQKLSERMQTTARGGFVSRDTVLDGYASEVEALEAQLAEAQTSNQRMRDLVRYKRHDLFNDGLIDQSEFASLVAETPGAVDRLEGYDKIKAQLAAANNKLDESIRDRLRLKAERDQAIRERDEARADADNSVVLEAVRRAGYNERSRAKRDASLDRETLAGHVRSGEKLSDVQSQCDALAKALQQLIDKVLEELPEKFAMQVTQNAREALAKLERPAPANGRKQHAEN